MAAFADGAPIVGKNGELVGIVSEGDLIRRPEIGTTKRHSWWLELLSNEWASAIITAPLSLVTCHRAGRARAKVGCSVLIL
jgi:hypothetical protein